MKKTLIFQLILPVILFFGIITSCEDIVDYNDHYDDGLTSTGAPVIGKITAVTDSTRHLSEATLDEMISVYGSNLSQVTSIRFNDVEADLSTVYAVNSRIVLPVPRQFPTNVDNTLTVTTKLGSATVPFVVTIPALVVEGLYNEFATAGDTVSVSGKNFDLYDIDTENGIVELNGQQLTILEASATSISFKIPDSTPDNSILQISSQNVPEPVAVGFRNWGYRILYYDTQNGGMWSGADFLTDGSHPGDPKPLTGVDQFSRIVGSFGAWSWNVPFGGGFNLDDADIVANPQNYYVKYEITTKSNKSLSIGNLIFGNYTWNPGEGGIAFNTYGKWKTMAIELTDFMSPVSGWNGYSIVFQLSADVDVDFSFCNLRIVKK